MKTRNLFLSLFAFAALCACNKEAQPEGPQVLGEDAYIDINIVAPGADTKSVTGTDFVVGSEKENNVKNVMVAFYTSAGNYVSSTTTISFDPWADADQNNPHVEQISAATVVLNGKSITPRKMVVILNYNEEIEGAVENAATLTELQAKLSSLVMNDTDSFVMTNSTYMDGTNIVFATPIEEDDLYTVGNKPADYTPVDVYVERLAAKVNVTTPANPTIKELELNDGTSIHYYPVIEGCNVTSTATKSYLIKNISDYNFTNWEENWNDAANYRSYWANTYGSTETDFNLLTYAEIGNTPNASLYMHENTNQDHLPKLMVKTSIKLSADGSSYTGTSIGDLVKVGPTYYMKDVLLAHVAQLLNNAGLTNKADNATFEASDLTITYNTGYYSNIVFAEGMGVISGKETEASNILAPYQNVLYWQEGKSYFYTNIEHFGSDAENKYGVVRNHVYNINVTAISGLGTPYSGGMGDITPEKPTDLVYNIEAKINILKWKVVNQNVELN